MMRLELHPADSAALKALVREAVAYNSAQFKADL